MGWQTSTRSGRLPTNWPAIKAQVKARANGRCQAPTHHPDCDGKGAEADHIHRGDNHALSNLQWLSTPCHWEKTKQENADRNKQAATLRRKPTEQHPGRRT